MIADRDVAHSRILGQLDRDGRGSVSRFAPPGQAQAHRVGMRTSLSVATTARSLRRRKIRASKQISDGLWVDWRQWAV